MRKWLKYILLFLGIYLAMTVVFAVSQAYFERKQNIPKTDFVRDQTYSARNVGPSMEPTLKDGGDFRVDPTKTPHIGDIVAFDCFSKCDQNGHFGSLVKRIIKIDDQGCFWVEGDNHSDSNDSIDFSWLCPSDIKIDGVVIQ